MLICSVRYLAFLCPKHRLYIKMDGCSYCDITFNSMVFTTLIFGATSDHNLEAYQLTLASLCIDCMGAMHRQRYSNQSLTKTAAETSEITQQTIIFVKYH